MSLAVKKLTYWEFREMEFDETDSNLYELLKGEIVKRASPTLIHQRILKNLLYDFETYLRQKKTGEIFPAPLDVVLNDENVPQPDLVYVSNANSAILNAGEPVIVGIPDLVVEILSTSTAKRDKTMKKDIYEDFGVLEYWLVDPVYKTIEVYTLQNNRYTLFSLSDMEDKLKSPLLPDLDMDMKTIFE